MQHSINITAEHCPMTFVKVKLQLSRIAAGDTLEVLLRKGEPLENVPRSAAEQGYIIESNEEVDSETHRLIIRKP